MRLAERSGESPVENQDNILSTDVAGQLDLISSKVV